MGRACFAHPQPRRVRNEPGQCGIGLGLMAACSDGLADPAVGRLTCRLWHGGTAIDHLAEERIDCVPSRVSVVRGAQATTPTTPGPGAPPWRQRLVEPPPVRRVAKDLGQGRRQQRGCVRSTIDPNSGSDLRNSLGVDELVDANSGITTCGTPPASAIIVVPKPPWPTTASVSGISAAWDHHCSTRAFVGNGPSEAAPIALPVVIRTRTGSLARASRTARYRPANGGSPAVTEPKVT